MKNIFDILTVCAAWIGALTGGIALIIQYFEYRLTKPKIICKLDNIYDSYWVTGKELLKGKSDNELTSTESLAKLCDVVILSLKISNTSNSPITVSGINSKGSSIMRGLEIPPVIKHFPKPYEKVALTLIAAQPHTFPVRLESNDSITSLLVLLVDADASSRKKVAITVETPSKKFPFKFRIKTSEEVITHKKIGDISRTLEKAMDDNNQNEAHN